MHRKILLVGATGQLGSRVGHYLAVERDADLRLLVHPGRLTNSDKTDAIAALRAGGASIHEGDLSDHDSLLRATEGVEVVISAVQGGPEVIIEGQAALAEAAKSNGVDRIFPSDFAVDLFKAPEGEHPLLGMRRTADEQIAAMGIETVHVLNGTFMDILLLPFFQVYDEANGTIRTGATEMSRSTAPASRTRRRYTARAALDPDLPPGKFAIAGQSLTFAGVARDLEQVTGKPLKRERLGSTADLENWIAETRRQNSDPMAVVPALYQLYMITGRTALSDLQNARYPDLRPENYRQFLQRTRLS